jgi:probable HAF family extracellular repeat protein
VAWRNGSVLTFAPLAQIQNAWVAEAHAVNDAGTVVGKSALAEPGVEHAFVAQVLLRGVGTTVDLGTLPSPFKESNAFGINDRGVIVGASSVAWGNTTCHAVMWVNRKIVDLGALAPGSWGSSAALGINETGEVVGFAGLDSAVDGVPYGATAGMRAVLWKNGAAVDLNDMIGPGWDLAVAHDVNNRGEIVGSGFKIGDAVPHGFELIPITRISSLTVSPSAVTGGKTAEATVALTRAAPPGGETVFVTTSFPGTSPVSAPAQVTLARGQSTATFSIVTSTVKRRTTGTIIATLDRKSSKASLTVASRS